MQLRTVIKKSNTFPYPTVLQYREKIGFMNSETVYSEWIDVPTIDENRGPLIVSHVKSEAELKTEISELMCKLYEVSGENSILSFNNSKYEERQNLPFLKRVWYSIINKPVYLMENK